MASTAVVCGGLIGLVLLVLQCVGLATHYWYVLEVTGLGKASAGLFQICIELDISALSALSGLTDRCYTYSDYITPENLKNFSYYGITGLSVIGCILLFANVIVGLVGCASTRPGRPTVQNLSAIWFIAAGCTIASVVWFCVKQYQDAQTLLGLSTYTSLVELKLGYSFYLVAAAGAGALVAAITMCVAANHMDAPQTVAPYVAPAGPQVFVMQSGVPQQGPAGFTQPGYQQPGYPQNGTGYPQTGTGYPQTGTGYPQTGAGYGEHSVVAMTDPPPTKN